MQFDVIMPGLFTLTTNWVSPFVFGMNLNRNKTTKTNGIIRYDKFLGNEGFKLLYSPSDLRFSTLDLSMK
jgi:hypothetical protein